jgi:WD40 repeat protein
MSTQNPVEIGADFVGYRIEELIGQGGMGVVYRAYDLRLRRTVALKLIAPELALDERFRERFARETELAMALEHPNVVPIHDAGDADGRLYLAMRLVEGTDLKALLVRPLEPAGALAICGQVANALDAAHAKGLVHRDVKPSNVLLDANEHVYLADFGLTRRLEDQGLQAGEGRSVGTPAYLAPEQIEGKPVDGRADVYALGCMLFECLTGSVPFRRSSRLATAWAHLEEEPPRPSAERPELPTALDAVIARALAKEPEERYESCRELVQAAFAVTFDEASRRLAEVASRAAAGRRDLSEVEAELQGKVIDLQLVRDQAQVVAGPSTPTRVAAEGICPFKGLASFEPVDAEYFFGRERLVAELVARLVGAGFLGIVGPSGSGKSSVLRAGLLPALAGGVLPGSGGWRRVLLRPGEHPLEELRRVFLSGARDPLAEALDALPAEGRLLIAIDQLEELHTACRSEDERTAFCDTLARAAADPERRAIVVVALRADFYGRFAAFPALSGLLGANQVLVGPMQASELRRAVELPARRVGLRVEPDLADALVDDVEGEPGALPLLSTALLELWQKREDDTLTLASHNESGGVHGAVARLAEGTYARIPDERKAIVRALMLRLVGEGERDAPVRRRAPLAELDLERSEDATEVLATLVDRRLVTVSEGAVEVAHEALLREWPRLRGWIEEDAEGRRLRRHITQAASEWDADGRDQGELYRGARLAAALDWSTDHAFELNELEREFVTESREASQQEVKQARRTNRRLRALLAGVAVLLAAAVAGGIFAAIQRGEARDAETAQLAQRLGAQALVEEDLDLSLLLARQAVAIDDSPRTRGYLLAALRNSPAAIGIMHGTDALRSIAISPDGKRLAVIGLRSGLLFFDARTYEQVGDPLPHYFAGSLAYSPDGRTLAVGGGQYVRLVDARTHEQLAETAFGGFPSRLAFTKDGSRLVVLFSPGSGTGTDLGGANARITIRDAATLKPAGPTIEPRAFVGAYVGFHWESPHFVLTADDRFLLTASEGGELAWWDLRSGEKTRTLPIARGLHALALSPDGRTAAVGIDRGIELVDLGRGTVQTATGSPAGRPDWLLFSPDGETLVSTHLDGTVTLWDVGSATRREALQGHSNSVQQPVFSPNGKTLYTVSHDGTAIAWDLTGARGLGRLFTFTHDPTISEIGVDGHPGTFSPDGRLIAVGLEERGIALWDVRRLAPVGAPLLNTGGEVKSLAFSPGGRTLAAAAVDDTVTLWDVRSRARLRAHTGAGVAFSPDGETLAISSGDFGTTRGDALTLFDTATGASLGEIGARGDSSDPSFSADGKMIATARGWEGGADVWDVDSRTPVATVKGQPYAPDWAVALSPDGHTLAVGGWGTLVRLIDVRTGKLLHELDQAGTGAREMEFSPDGRTLAVSGWEDVASLWDVASGAQIGPRFTAGRRRTSLDLSPDGRRLLTTFGNGQGAVWDVDPESWKQRACTLANRTLTRKEWAEFLPGRPYEPACR